MCFSIIRLRATACSAFENFLDGALLDEKAPRLVEMPATDTYEKFAEWTKRRARNGPPSLRAGGAG